MISTPLKLSLSPALQTTGGFTGWEDTEDEKELAFGHFKQGSFSAEACSEPWYPDTRGAKETTATGLYLLAKTARDGQENVGQNEAPWFSFCLKTPHCFMEGSAFKLESPQCHQFIPGRFSPPVPALSP